MNDQLAYPILAEPLLTPLPEIPPVPSHVPPLEYEWAVVDDHDTITYQASGTTEEAYIKDLNLETIERFVLQDSERHDVFGIHRKSKSFMIFGVQFRTDLPIDREYKVFFMRRNREYSDGTFMRWYILGLQAIEVVDEAYQERYLYINPDTTFTVTTTFI